MPGKTRPWTPAPLGSQHRYFTSHIFGYSLKLVSQVAHQKPGQLTNSETGLQDFNQEHRTEHFLQPRCHCLTLNQISSLVQFSK
ncbi:hypothetical protein ACRRTK_022850 [Alexandromys fortis]